MYIYDWYLTSSLRKLKKKAIPVMTEHIETKYHQVKHAIRLITTKFNSVMELRLKQLVDDLIRTINITFPMHKSKAPFITQETAQIVAENLWSFDRKGRGYGQRSKDIRKAAAVNLLLSVFAGGRWGDVENLHWSDIMITKQPHGEYLHIRLRRSKNNEKNEQPQGFTYCKDPEGPPTNCAFRLLEEFRKIRGQPSKGRIFEGFGKKSLLKAVQMMSQELQVQKPTGHSGKKNNKNLG